MDSTRAVAHSAGMGSSSRGAEAIHSLTGEPAPETAPWAQLQPDAASQAQIIRSHQRDSAHVSRLNELVSELVRSVAGTRWLAHKQTLIDLSVRAAYLLLTFGRGYQTLGEEYTEVLPAVRPRNVAPSRRRRLLTILLLLLPTVVTSPSFLNYLRGDPHEVESSNWARFKSRIVKFLESPIGQAMPELHLVVFMFGGRFYEFARRLTRTSYISAQPPRTPEMRAASYEPLGLLMALPLLYRLFPSRRSVTGGEGTSTSALTPAKPRSPTSHSGSPTPRQPSADDNVVVDSETDYDAPNTYLAEEARELPERQCTLCLEPHGTGEGSGGTTAVTECGHVFCWGCLGGLDKMECPLCRQALRMERLVAAYNL